MGAAGYITQICAGLQRSSAFPGANGHLPGLSSANTDELSSVSFVICTKA